MAFFDVTGSMGHIPRVLQGKLAKLMDVIIEKAGVKDSQILVGAIGDTHTDTYPFQVGQFESDNRFDEQLRSIILEGGGGGQDMESYGLAYRFAAHHTATDSFEKRGKKGYIFTVGDEEPTRIIRASAIANFLSGGAQADMSAEELLDMVSKSYHVFHLMVEQGNHMKWGSRNQVIKAWTDLLGQRALLLSDYTKMSEVIVSAIQVNEGADADAVIGSWDGDTSLVVRKAVNALAAGAIAESGIVSF
jgi:hypothetical protein